MIDEKAKNILLNETNATDEEIEYAKSVGYWAENVNLDHDDAMISLNNIIYDIDKEVLANNFLYSLSTRKLVYRTGLGAYAHSINMPVHGYPIVENQQACEICLDYAKGTERNINRIRKYMFQLGETSRSVAHLYYTLEFSLRLGEQIPKSNDIDILKQIFRLIETAEEELSAPKVCELIAKKRLFKSNYDERRIIFQILGYLGILETSEHKGFRMHYTNGRYQDVTRKSSRSEFEYPVGWWSTSDGINHEAVKFWFPKYAKHLLSENIITNK